MCERENGRYFCDCENTSDVVMCMCGSVCVCVCSQVKMCWRVLGGAGVWTSSGDFSLPSAKCHSVIIAPLNAAVNHRGPLILGYADQV